MDAHLCPPVKSAPGSPDPACPAITESRDLTPRAETGVDAAGPGRQASRTCPRHRDPATCDAGGGSAPSVTARDPHRPGRRPAAPTPGGIPPAPCRDRDAGLTARPEQSAGRAGRTYRHRQRTRTARDTAPATPADEPAAAPGALLTIEEVIAELRVSRAAFYRWRRRGTGPAEVRLPGGGVRIRRSALQAWLHRLEQPQQEDTPK